MKGFKKTNIGQGIDLYVLPTDKFKTVSISYCFHRDLDEYYTYNALIPAVMRRGCQGYETLRDMERHLESQYGAIFDVGVQKKGERHLLRFSMDIVNDNYIPHDDTAVVAQAFHFLNRVITKPVLEDGVFKSEYVEQEKQNLKNRIEALINDKMAYSAERCLQIMCENEKYRRYVYGDVQELDQIDSAALYGVYREILETSPLDIFVVGDVENLDIEQILNNSLKLDRGIIKSIPETAIKKIGVEPKEYIERADITQGKLNMGLRTNTSFTDREYYPLVVCSAVLGGGPQSKLFMNVREKASLAYYAFSQLEKFKGLMLIGAGIDFANYDQTVDIIKEQLDDIKNGVISDKELDAAKKNIVTSLKAMQDQPGQIIDYYLGNVICNTNQTIDDHIEAIEIVEKDDISKVAERIKLDTIYFLRDK